MGERNGSLWLLGVGITFLAAIGVFGLLTAESVAVGGLAGVLDPLEWFGAVFGASDAQLSGFAFGFIAGMVGLAAVYLGYIRRSRRPAPA